MSAFDPDEQLLEQMKLKSAQLAGNDPNGPSKLPHDPTLTADAIALREQNETPLEWLGRVRRGEVEPTSAQLAAARAELEYYHKKQVARVQSEVTVNGIDPTLAATLGIATPEERARLRAEANAALAAVKQVH
jgi:hypothetical protein